MTADENVIEFLRNQDIATLTLSQSSFKNTIRRLADEDKNVTIELDDKETGYMVAHLPVSYIKFRPPLHISEEEKERRKERLLQSLQERKSQDV